MQHAVTPIAGDGAKRRAALDAEPAALLEQPLVQQHAVKAAALVHVKPQHGRLHAIPFRPNSKRTQYTPAMVSSSEPIRCGPMWAADRGKSRRNSSTVVSAEKRSEERRVGKECR